jgi:hypothetical protein
MPTKELTRRQMLGLALATPLLGAIPRVFSQIAESQAWHHKLRFSQIVESQAWHRKNMPTKEQVASQAWHHKLRFSQIAESQAWHHK